MTEITRRRILATAPAALTLAAPFLSIGPARAAKQYGPGVTDTEIKIGNTGPYTGPYASAGAIPLSMAAYYKMINAQGGINGRKINFISYDDGYSPPKTVEMTRKLVEQDNVLFVNGAVGTPTNTSVWHYLNEKKVPQLFIFTGASKWDDPKGHPWTIGFLVSYRGEGQIYGGYILAHKPDGKVGILYQNDDFGKDYLNGVLDGLGGKAASAVKATYQTTDPTVDSQIVTMKAAGCDVLVMIALPKFAAQAIRKAAAIDWKPLQILIGGTASVGQTMKPAGFENSQGVISDNSFKDPTDPSWQNDSNYKWWVSFMDKYHPKGDKSDIYNAWGPSNAATVVQVLKQCGDELTRENVMKQAANLHHLTLPMLLPGITVNTSPTDFASIKQVQMERFEGDRFHRFGPILTSGNG